MTPVTFLTKLAHPQTPFLISLAGFNRCAPDWQVGPRQLEEHLCYVLADGVLAGQIAGQELRLHGGGALCLPPQLPHRFAIPDQGRPMQVYHFRFTCPAALSRAVLVEQGDRLNLLASVLMSQLHGGQVSTKLHRLRQRTALVGLLSALIEADEEQQSQQPRLTSVQRYAIECYLEQQSPHARPAPRELAEVLGLSPTWFARRFTASYGRSPRGWLKARRLRQAAAMLQESNESISAVAEHFGYLEPAKFSRQFREELGCSPRAWRQGTV